MPNSASPREWNWFKRRPATPRSLWTYRGRHQLAHDLLGNLIAVILLSRPADVVGRKTVIGHGSIDRGRTGLMDVRSSSILRRSRPSLALPPPAPALPRPHLAHRFQPVLQRAPVLLQAAAARFGLLLERLFGPFEQSAQILTRRAARGQARQRLLYATPQPARHRVGHPDGRYRMDRACPLPEQLGMQVPAAFRPRLGLLDRNSIGFGPSVLANAGDLPADLDPARVSLDGEF